MGGAARIIAPVTRVTSYGTETCSRIKACALASAPPCRFLPKINEASRPRSPRRFTEARRCLVRLRVRARARARARVRARVRARARARARARDRAEEARTGQGRSSGEAPRRVRVRC